MVLSKKFSPFILVQWTRKRLFWQPYEFLPGENRKFFNQGSKKILKNYLFFSEKVFFSINANRNRVDFWQPRRKTFDKKLKFFRSMYEHVSKNEQFSKRAFFLQIVPLDTQNPFLTAPTKFLWQKVKKCSLNIRKKWKNSKILSERISILEKFFWKHRIKFEKTAEI